MLYQVSLPSNFVKLYFAVFILVTAVSSFSRTLKADTCTYETWDWDTIQKKAINLKKINKPKAELTQEEKGPTEGCSVCQEDQVDIQIERIPTFKVCKIIKDKILDAVNKTLKSNFSILSAVGYRVGKTKGPLNSNGHRTQFSNHSYGMAVDFNSEKNGLYDLCPSFNSSCKLIRGGPYYPGGLGGITPESAIYKNMIAQGFKWGGEINGKQKDFMHFSLSGM